jgi:ribosomal protein S18 acetylase RimI-like enzyme
MIIRNAKIADSEAIATLLLLAMEDIIYKFIGKRDQADALNFMKHFVSAENNQYSFQNCLVTESNGIIAAALNLYNGGELARLREPVINYVTSNFNAEFNPEDETQSGEYYIDSLGVRPELQGRGIGTQLLQFVIDKYVTRQRQTLGLLVDEENPDVRKLYLKLGFKSVGAKTLVGKRMEHLQMIPSDGKMNHRKFRHLLYVSHSVTAYI